MIDLSDLKRPVREAAVIIAIACALGFLANLLHPRGYRLVPAAPPPRGVIVHIGAVEAKTKFDRGAALFIDARAASEFSASAVSGAVNLPARPEPPAPDTVRDRVALLRQSVEPVIYCNGETPDCAEALARSLVEAGFPGAVYVLSGGLAEWKAMGFPTRHDSGEPGE